MPPVIARACPVKPSRKLPMKEISRTAPGVRTKVKRGTEDVAFPEIQKPLNEFFGGLKTTWAGKALETHLSETLTEGEPIEVVDSWVNSRSIVSPTVAADHASNFNNSIEPIREVAAVEPVQAYRICAKFCAEIDAAIVASVSLRYLTFFEKVQVGVN